MQFNGSCIVLVSLEIVWVEYIEVIFFFFQAEDGIRDYKVTGVQTCALPIFWLSAASICCARSSALWRASSASAWALRFSPSRLAGSPGVTSMMAVGSGSPA